MVGVSQQNLSIDQEIEALMSKIKEFSLQQKDFLLVFLFGSYAKGYATRKSDVDIAIVFEKIPNFYELSDLEYRLSTYLRKEADILVLNNVSPIIKFQVLKYGLLIKMDRRTYNDFFVKTIGEYEDLKFLRKEIEENILKGRIYA